MKRGRFGYASSYISESRCGAPGGNSDLFPPTLRFPTPASETRARRGPRLAQDGAPPFVAGSREIKGGPHTLPNEWVGDLSLVDLVRLRELPIPTFFMHHVAGAQTAVRLGLLLNCRRPARDVEFAELQHPLQPAARMDRILITRQGVITH